MSIGKDIPDRYQMGRLLFRGTFTSVYSVKDMEQGGKFLTLKEMVFTIPNPAMQKVTEFLFDKEIEILKKLQHPNIARIYDGFHHGGRFYLIQDMVEGENFQEIMEKRERGFRGEEILQWQREFASILEYINGLSVSKKIFRDFNPSNFMLDIQGNIRWVGFGLSRLFYPPDVNFRSLSGFFPPEEDGENSDVYSFGSFFYYLCTKKVPGDLKGEIPPPISTNTSCSRHYSDLIFDCLQFKEKKIKNVKNLKSRIEKADKKTRDQQAMEEFRRENIEKNRAIIKKLMISIFLIAGILCLLYPFMKKIKNEIDMKICKGNCDKISKALVMYAKAHNGEFPDRLEELIPQYLPKIPECPSCSKNTYSSSYKAYNFSGLSYCRFSCQGEYHKKAGLLQDFPQFNSREGVLTAPSQKTPWGGSLPVEILLEGFLLDSKKEYQSAYNKFQSLSSLDQQTFYKETGMEKYLLFWNMARILGKMGKKQESRSQYKKTAQLLLQKDFKNFDKQITLLFIQELIALGEKKYAQDFFNTLTSQYVKRDAPRLESIIEMVDIYEEMKNPESAVSLLEQFYKKCPSQDNNLVLGEIHRLEGDKAKSLFYYRQYIEQPQGKSLPQRAEKMQEIVQQKRNKIPEGKGNFQ